MALVCNPEVLICDEPTTALDVTIQAEILTLIRELQQRLNNSVIFITHNLHHVFDVSDRIGVFAHGTKVGDFSRDAVSEEQIVDMIMGTTENRAGASFDSAQDRQESG